MSELHRASQTPTLWNGRARWKSSQPPSRAKSGGDATARWATQRTSGEAPRTAARWAAARPVAGTARESARKAGDRWTPHQMRPG